MKKCASCTDDAILHCRWGPDEPQQGNFCKDHAREAWERVKPLVAIDKLWWTNREIT